MGKHYLKEIYTEQWDPMQRSFLMQASNQAWFELCRNYFTDQLPIKTRYSHKIAKWHRKRLAHLARGIPFHEAKPANANRNADTIGDDLNKVSKKIGKFFKSAF